MSAANKALMRRAFGEVIEPFRCRTLRLGWRHVSGAHGWHNHDLHRALGSFTRRRSAA